MWEMYGVARVCGELLALYSKWRGVMWLLDLDQGLNKVCFLIIF